MATSIRRELRSIVQVLFTMLAALWALEIVDVFVLGGRLDGLGIRPRDPLGLVGVLCAPLLHGGLGHLVSNTIGLLVFGTLVLMWGRREFFATVIVSALVGGLGTWLVGAPHSLHIGASTVVFGLFGYLVARGYYERRIGSMILSIAIGILFGGMLAGVVPGLAGAHISWEGHLFGLVGGVLVARRLRPRPMLQRR